MGLIKEYNTYNDRPINADNIIDKLHYKYQNNKKEYQFRCPSCCEENYNFAFNKYNFHYVQCSNCMSLYIQNMLNETDVSNYEAQLEEELYSSSEYKNYLEILTEKISLELELTFSRLFSKKIKQNILYYGNKGSLYKNGLKDFSINFDLSTNIKEDSYNMIIIDHFIEKSNNLGLFMSKVNSLLVDDGIIYITIRVGSGIDILTLWEDSSLYPIEHNRLLSIDGIKILLKKNNFQLKELNTPGVLDLKNILKSESKNIPRYLEYLNGTENKKAMEELQIFLQRNLLSSFATVIAQKVKNA